ncbi:MAG: HI1506-related protein [Bilophila sp.]
MALVGDIMIRITTIRDGFRRAGIVHTGTQDYADTDFTPEQLALLRAEPLLIVVETPKAPAGTEDDPALPQAEKAKGDKA